jgi:hypothetical protein
MPSGAQVGEPLPTVDALDGDDGILSVWSDGEKKADRVAGKAPVQAQLCVRRLCS